ncbi:hypothetical protein OSB04_003104 [Centaurea solstitialis]|uniref:Polyprotein n=1 Tax=Centaurea solstitialis TaxID=347529 RepID=A0AA38U1R0_9ASTR|nr:hypothetical protein OSB04_003104 [Centaurea solstitialis]
MASTVTSTNNLSLRSILEKDKLTGPNFLDWERNLMIVLRHERKWYVLEESLREAPPANAPAAARNAHKKHSDDLLDVACLMLATMSPDLQAGLINTNAYDMIRQLRDMFQTQARTERYDATKAFNECKMIKGTSVSDHVMKMKRHLDHLERLGHPVPLQLATDTILNSLSDDYKPFVVNYNMNNMEKSIAELHSMLKTAELNMGTKNKTKDVLMVRDGGVKKKNGHTSTSKGKGPVQAVQSAPKKGKGKGKGKKVKPNKARTENRCFTCNEIGHWRQNCPKRHEADKHVSRPKSNSPEKEFTQYFKYLEDESDVMSILIFSISPELAGDLRVKSCHEVVKDMENQSGFYKHTGKLLIMKEILSLKLRKNQSVKDHLIEMKRLFKCLTRLGYKMTQEELVYLMWYSLSKEICDTASAYMKEPKIDVAKVHENILASLEPKPSPAELMDSDWIDELGDLSCPECGSQDICEHSLNIDQIEIGLPDAPGIFMIDCLITSYESWVIDTGSGNHICNHLQGFTRRETLRKDRSNLRVGEGTPLIAEAVGSYSLSLPSGLVLELENCYYVPKMIKNVMSFDLLVDQGFYYKYDYKMLSVFKNNIFYFKATPVNGLYTINLQDDNKEIYHISKRSKDIEDQTYLWHCRLGHINKKRVELLLKGGFLGTFDFKPFDNYESCLSGKMTKEPFNKDNERATDLLEIVHTNVCGPFSHEARGGYRYFITFTDDFSRYGYVYLMRHKSESFEKFREYHNEVQNQLDRKIKFLRSNRGGEYLSQEFGNHLMECGIVSQPTPPYTPQMNGVSERRNHTLLDMVRSMMCRSTLPVSFWGHALETAAHILNRAPTKSVEKTPYELWKEKLKPKSDKCFFVGYPKTTVGYYFYNPEEKKVFVARNGKILEEKFLSSENTREDVDLQVVDEDNTAPTVEPEIQHENVEPQSEPIEEVQTQDLRRSTRVRQEPDRYLGFLVSQVGGDLNESTSYGEPVSGSESKQWQEAMKAEMQSMYDNQVWELTDLPQHCRAVGRKWVFKKKTDMDGNVHTFKARLVAKGFMQTHGIDYDETFSPVAMLKSIRILMAISTYFNYKIWQMDVNTAFLNGKLTEDVYMEQAEGFKDPKNPNKVCKLLKSIYGLKQASRSWNLHFDERIKEFGFAKSEFEPCVYTKFSGSIVTFLVLYVDDILLIGNDVPTLQSVKSWLSKCFQMKDLGEAAYILGIKIYRNRSKRLIGLSQSTYIDKIMKKFRMDESKKGFIPMQHGIVLSKTQCPLSSQDQDKMKSVPYASAIGSIMYAMLCTRPDVAYSVSVTSRYQQNPGEPHWVAVKNILKYLRRTKDMFLIFGGSEDEISVTGYSDASFQTDRDDFRSQSGYIFTLNGGAISWKRSKQDTIADSTTEAEYIAASDAAKEAVWLRNFLSDLRVVASVSRPIDIFCDNSGAVAQAKEPREHHKSRHVLRKYHLIREIIGRGDVRICKIPMEDNVADPLTKPLARVKHEAHASSIGMQYLDTRYFTGKARSLDQASFSITQTVFSAITNRHLNYAKVIYDDMLKRLKEPTRRRYVAYPRLFSAVVALQIQQRYPTTSVFKNFVIGIKTLDHPTYEVDVPLSTVLWFPLKKIQCHPTPLQRSPHSSAPTSPLLQKRLTHAATRKGKSYMYVKEMLYGESSTQLEPKVSSLKISVTKDSNQYDAIPTLGNTNHNTLLSSMKDNESSSAHLATNFPGSMPSPPCIQQDDLGDDDDHYATDVERTLADVEAKRHEAEKARLEAETHKKSQADEDAQKLKDGTAQLLAAQAA